MSTRIHDRASQRGDDTPVMGGLEDVSRYLVDLPEPTIEATDELTREILTLLALHPGTTIPCAEADLAVRDDATKREILEELRRQLGIRPLRRREV